MDPRIGLQRNPITIEFTALDDYNSFQKNMNNDSRQSFLNNANWLVQNALSRGNYSILDYHFRYPVPYPPSNSMHPPWHSGMAQGQALSVLTRAFDITNNKKYLDSARAIMNSFFVEVKDGGVTYKSQNDGWWYEAYPDHRSSA